MSAFLLLFRPHNLTVMLHPTKEHSPTTLYITIEVFNFGI